MKFKAGQKVKRTITWDDGAQDVSYGEVIKTYCGTVTCIILVDQYRTMKFLAENGRSMTQMEGIKAEWIEVV